MVRSPFRLSSIVTAISAAAPEQLSIYPESSSKRSIDVPRRALTDLRSTLLKMSLKACDLSASVIVLKASLRS